MRKQEDPTRDPASEARDDWEEREDAIRFSSVNRELAAQVARLERELEQERQDRKQADIDTIRALGERNDARRQVQELLELGKEASDNLAEANSEIEKLQRQLDQALKLGFEAARIAKNRGRCQ